MKYPDLTLDDSVTWKNLLRKLDIKQSDIDWYFGGRVLEESYEEAAAKQSELQRHLLFYKCLNKSKGPYCE